MFTVSVYTLFNTTHTINVGSFDKAKEYASRIGTEGFWYAENSASVFLPVHQIVKVKIQPSAS